VGAIGLDQELVGNPGDAATENDPVGGLLGSSLCGKVKEENE